MKILFCNIGWMEFYHGQSSADQIVGGGSYIKSEGMGHEVCNFVEHNGSVFGYVQPPKASSLGEGTIRIERISEDAVNSVENVTVVWTSTRPEGGTVIVGWYKDATVFSSYQEFKEIPNLHKVNELNGYWIKSKFRNTTLLPLDERVFEIPRRIKGGMGQANIWYADKPESLSIRTKVSEFIENRRTEQVRYSKTTDPEHNAKVELAAIQKVISYFSNLGYQVNSVEKDNVGWDLEAISGKSNLIRIEVKGLSANLAIGGLSPNEYTAFSKKSSDYRLAIVINALSEPIMLLCRYSQEKKKWVVEGNPKIEVEVNEKISAYVKICI